MVSWGMRPEDTVQQAHLVGEELNCLSCLDL